MSASIRKYWQGISKKEPAAVTVVEPSTAKESRAAKAIEVDIQADDPLLAYLLTAPGVVDVTRLEMHSSTLDSLKEAGVRLVVPLVSQGELIGLLNLGPRLSEQEYSSYDNRLLSNLGTQAAPALRVAQLARQQQAEARLRERMEQELRVARVIQQTLLPKEVPQIPGWQVAAYWQPARAVSGDFYDFIDYPDGKLGFVVGDVTDKGVPAALVMATTRSVLRAAVERLPSPSQILEQANNLLCPDIPPNMFVTCLYGILDPASGYLIYANAGHNLPIKRSEQGVTELRATGMPLGLLPGMTYEEKEAWLCPGESIFLFSDGLVEAHNQDGEMFGFPRLREIMASHPGGAGLIELLVNELAQFTGPGWEQEDDVTFVTLESVEVKVETPVPPNENQEKPVDEQWRILAEFKLPSEPGNERQAMEKVALSVQTLDLPNAQVERLKTAVAEATMNAMEHGNHYQPDLPVEVKVAASEKDLVVYITDHSGEHAIPENVAPDLDAKLAGLQSPRGWGLFLIKSMVDEMHVSSDKTHHTVELVLHRKGGEHDQAPV